MSLTKLTVKENIMNMSAPAVNAPSIASSAMLVEFSVSTWTARKKDRKATNDVAERNNLASKELTNVTKKLIDCEELSAVVKFGANARNIHYSMTMPWSDMGQRIVTTQQYFKYHEVMTELQQEFDRLTQAFLEVYDYEVTEMQLKLGDMWNRDEYPTADAIQDRFRMRISYMPLPDAGDWRIDIQNEAQQQLTQQYEQYYNNQIQSAMNDLWHKLHDNLTTLVRQLDYDADGKRNRVYDTVFDRAHELVEMLSTCNVTGDSQMEAMRQRLDTALYGLTADAVKRDDTLRDTAREKVKDAIANLPSLDF